MSQQRKARWRLLPVLLLATVLSPLPSSLAWGEEEYVVGVDDVLHIQVWDHKDLDQDVPVRADGKISFPLAGEVQASGLTVPQLTNLLTARLSKSVRNPNVSVIVKEMRSYRVHFVGQVLRPGVYPIQARTPLLQAVTLAGGPVEGADLSAAYVVRGDKRIPVDLRRLLQEGDLSQNVPLQTGDTVVVPKIAASSNPQDVLERRVYILGKVQKPGIYAVRQELPILQAIFLAGGMVEPEANLSGVYVIRGKERIAIDLRRLIQKGDLSQNVMIRPEDTIVVPEGGTLQSSVFIMGEITKPGSYPQAEALTLMKLVSLAGGFTKFAAPGRITIIRENGVADKNGKKQQIRLSVNFNAIQRNPKDNPDIAVEPGDVVVVPETLF